MLKGKRTCCFPLALRLHFLFTLFCCWHHHTTYRTTTHLIRTRQEAIGKASFHRQTPFSSQHRQNAHHYASPLRPPSPRLRRKHLRSDLHTSCSTVSFANPLATHQRFRWRPLDWQASNNLLPQCHCSRNANPMPQCDLQHHLHRPR